MASALPAAGKPVLTTGKVGGIAVKAGAKLSASAEKGTTVTFGIGGGSAACASASFTARVVKNPSAKGKATLSITSEKISGCPPVTVGGFSATVSLSAINLPYDGTISTAKGHPIVIAESDTSKPTGFDATVDVTGLGSFACIFTATSASGHASNKHSTVAFSGQTFTLNKALTGADFTDCSLAGTSASFTATLGPVLDKSVRHSPRIFVS